ncbi:MAG: DNA repair protein RadC [Bacteroidetes bacterium]|nr:DNA repair protein RadC [Bacteroidota bacterium]
MQPSYPFPQIKYEVPHFFSDVKTAPITWNRVTPKKKFKKPKTGINSWEPADRPRERLLLKGPQALSTAELLAIFIRTGRNKANAVDLAQELLNAANNNLHELGKFSVKKLMKIKGIGVAKAITIAAALELTRRKESSPYRKKDMLNNSLSAANYLRALIKDNSQEVLCILYLNQAGHINEFEIINQGGFTSALADPRVILKKALETDAVSIILCHNHPSGSSQPSKADRDLTARLHAAGRILDIKLLDHIIIGNEDYFSFADSGLLAP